MAREQQKRLLMLTFGGWEHASSRIRAAEYIPYLERAGFRVTWIPRVPAIERKGAGRLAFPISKRLFALKRIAMLLGRRWDLVFLQRITLPGFVCRALRRRGIPVLFDMDDAIYLSPPGPPGSAERVSATIRCSQVIVVATEELAPFCRERGIEPEIITTPVDVDRITPGSRKEFVIGWMGSHWTALYLALVAGALRELASDPGTRIRVVGAGTDVLPGIDVEQIPWSYDTEAGALREMSVGIMPLSDDDWARGKGGYKLLQYMAAGLPVVASPVGINTRIVRHGETGFLASTGSEWVEALRRLRDDPDLRRKMGRRGRELAETQYSREVCFGKLLSVIDKLTPR